MATEEWHEQFRAALKRSDRPIRSVRLVTGKFPSDSQKVTHSDNEPTAHDSVAIADALGIDVSQLNISRSYIGDEMGGEGCEHRQATETSAAFGSLDDLAGSEEFLEVWAQLGHSDRQCVLRTMRAFADGK